VCSLSVYRYCFIIFGLMMVPLNRNIWPNFNIDHCVCILLCYWLEWGIVFLQYITEWLLSKAYYCPICRNAVSIGDLTWHKHVDISMCLFHDEINQIVWGLFQYELLVKHASCATVETHKVYCHVNARGFCRDFTFALSVIWGPR